MIAFINSIIGKQYLFIICIDEKKADISIEPKQINSECFKFGPYKYLAYEKKADLIKELWSIVTSEVNLKQLSILINKLTNEDTNDLELSIDSIIRK